MKFKLDRRMFSYCIYTLIVMIVAISFTLTLLNVDYFIKQLNFIMGLLSPFIWGIAIAYFLWRPIVFFEKILKKVLKSPKIIRTVAMVIVFLIACVVVFAIGSIIGPQLAQSIITLANNVPGYITALEEAGNNIIFNLGLAESLYDMLNTFWDKIAAFIQQILSTIVPIIIDASVSITSGIMNLVVGIVVSIYLVSEKEVFMAQISRVSKAFFPQTFNSSCKLFIDVFDDTFGRYISGQLIDAVIVGTLCFLAMSVLQLPYALLVGVIVACTNVIPYVGPFIGAVPSAFIILMAGEPLQALWFVMLIFVLQQIDGNILVPRIIGDSTGLSGFWVLFAILVGGGIFGILGVLLAVPTLAVIFKILRIIVRNRLDEKESKSAINSKALELEEANVNEQKP